MSRKIKNVIIIVLIILTIGCVGGTMYYAKTHVTTTTNSGEMMPPSGIGNDNNQPQSPNAGGNDSQGEPPEKPDGESNQTTQGQPPEKPDGDEASESGERPEMPNEGQNGMPSGNQNGNATKSISTGYYVAFAVEGLVLSSLVIYLILSNCNKKSFKETFENKDKIIIGVLSIIICSCLITLGSSVFTNKVVLNSESSEVEKKQDNGSNTSGATYSSNTSITENSSIKDEEYTSTNSEENAVSVSKASVTLDNVKVTKTGDSTSGDNSNFYGTNSAIIAKDGATLTIKNSEVTTDADGANGVFSYGGSATTNNSSSDGTAVNISNTKITTTGDNAGGIMTTGGGVTNASNLDITTSGTSSAAIRTDRGGGEVNVDGGSYKTTGKGSPAVYSTADISIKNATLTATSSEGIVIEGKNSVSIENVTLTDTNSTLNGQSTTYKNIFLYQSMSGDAADGTATFIAKNSKIITNKGDTLYVTNTTAEITLSNNTITNNDSDGYFLRIQKDSWGNSGSNGGDVTLNLINQAAKGDIYVDSISSLIINLTDNSSYTGAINTQNTAKSIALKLDKSSKITLTSDTYVSSLDDEDEDYSNIDFNGYKLYVNNKAIN